MQRFFESLEGRKFLSADVPAGTFVVQLTGDTLTVTTAAGTFLAQGPLSNDLPARLVISGLAADGTAVGDVKISFEPLSVEEAAAIPAATDSVATESLVAEPAVAAKSTPPGSGTSTFESVASTILNDQGSVLSL